MRLKVHESGTAYFSDDLRGEGFVGELTITPHACAAILEKPGAEPEDILRSLSTLRNHYKQLAEIKKRKSQGNKTSGE